MGMARFLIRRILAGIIVLWVVATLTFFLFFIAVPRRVVARNLAGRAASRRSSRAGRPGTSGSTSPCSSSTGTISDRLLHGNLGYSYYSQEPVTTIIKQALPATLSLVIGGVLLWLIVGLGVGILSATQGRAACSTGSRPWACWPACQRPSSCSAQLLILGRVPAAEPARLQLDPDRLQPVSQGFSAWLGHMILPWITLAIVQAAVYTRLSRGRCSTPSARTTSGPRGPRASPSAGCCTGTRSGRR